MGHSLFPALTGVSGESWPCAAEEHSQGAAPLICLPVMEGNPPGSPSCWCPALNICMPSALLKTSPTLQLLGMGQAVLLPLSGAGLGLSQVGICSEWGLCSCCPLSLAHPSAVLRGGGAAAPKVTAAISNAAVCPDLVFQGCHALEGLLLECQLAGISGVKPPGVLGCCAAVCLSLCCRCPVLQALSPPGQSVWPVLLQGKQAAFLGHGSHNVLPSKGQAPFQQRDGELVKHQSLHPN